MTDDIAAARMALGSVATGVDVVLNRLSRTSDFERLVIELTTPTRRVVLSGVGKSGAIAVQAAATWRTLGIDAQVLHPTDAMHGDCGVLRAQDVAILLSYSGETREIVKLARHLSRMGVRLAAITQPCSTLSQLCERLLPLTLLLEGNKLNLPMSSATQQSAWLTALSGALIERLGNASTLRTVHPDGALGGVA